MKKEVEVIAKESKSFCDICGEEMFNPSIKISNLIIRNINTTVEYNSLGCPSSVEMAAIINYLDKDVCWCCIEKALNKALKDLYAKMEG